jgi:ubiquitin carboxyl-terminal hydrolase 34
MVDENDQATEEKSHMAAGNEEAADSPRRSFLRAIQFLQLFLARYRSNPGFALPDLRSLIPEAPSEVEGDLTALKYQSFDGIVQTTVKPLNIGKLNTAASLLASLREETGFENYRAYYRGRPFVPTEHDICKSLEDLQVREGLILVKKEDLKMRSSSRVKAGASPLEVEISGYFDELQSYLDLEEPMGREVCLTVLDFVAYKKLTQLDSSFSVYDACRPTLDANL